MATEKSGGQSSKPGAVNGRTAAPPAKNTTTATTTKGSKTTPPSASAKGGRAGVQPPPAPRKDERYTVKPELWESLLDSIPPWGDEIIALTLIMFGVVSALSLINVSADATLAAAWSNALTGLFGYGSFIVCAGLFALGVMLLLPKVGIVIRFPTRRILALELAFFSALALFHLLSGEEELRSLARVGRGGGQVGWAVSSALTSIFGIPVSALIFALLLLIAFAMMIGIRRTQISRLLTAGSARLKAYSARVTPPRRIAPVKVAALDEAMRTPVAVDAATGAPVLIMPTAAQIQHAKSFHLVRVRAKREHLPPSLRNAPNTTPAISEKTSEAANHPLFQKREEPLLPLDFNAVGTVQGRPRKDGGALMVERPDGRTKRYFTVANLKEPRGGHKRDLALPPLNLLRESELALPDEREINNNVVLIENTLLEFDIDVDVVDVKVGPTVTQYALQPFRENPSDDGEIKFSRTRISKIASLQSDLALALSARRLRMELPVPGTNYIGIEVPNRRPSMVTLRSVYESKVYQDEATKRKSPLFVPLGRDVAGVPVGVDLATMPHLLIAGTTGSGKSVCIAGLASSLILENTPERLRLVMLDPKRVELTRFNGIPHLIGPVETDQERMIGVLRWCVREMERRYKLLEESAARNIDNFNSKLNRRRKDEALPYIVIFIDEVGDLMLSQPEETEKTIARLAQMARAVGMHLIVATQRPSVDVITGLIKANFPSRISFAVASGIDSRVILDTVGAETLMGRGDMLYQAADAMAPRRIQGCFISDDEVRTITEYWQAWGEKHGKPAANDETAEAAPWERGLTRREILSETDPMLEQAISIVIAEGEASASFIQRKLNLGYPRAARIIDLMAELGVVGPAIPGARSREVLFKPGEDPFKDAVEKRMKERE